MASSATQQQEVDGAGVAGMRVRGAEEEGPHVGRIQPEGQLAAEDAAFGARPLAGDDGDAAEAVGLGLVEEAADGGMGVLGAAAMQVEGALGAGAAAAQLAPSPGIEAGR